MRAPDGSGRGERGPAGQVVVVTGATGGVGRATARAFAARGAGVALLARGERGLDAAAADVRAAGGRPLVVPVDVSDAQAVDAAASRVEAELGPIDVWVNNAFTTVFAMFEDILPEEFRRVTEVTYLGYVHGTRAALRRMRTRGQGTIVQVGSALAYRGVPLQSAYCGAEHAIQGFNESLRCELLRSGTRIRVTMVQLPALSLPQVRWVRTLLPGKARPEGPTYRPEVAVRAIVHAADHPERREYRVGGGTVLTLLVNALAPGLFDRYLAEASFRSRQTVRLRSTRQPTNLWAPADDVGGYDFGARGALDDRDGSRSARLWASRHRGALGLAAGLAAAGAVTGTAVARRRHPRRGAARDPRRGTAR
jgi:NAD(P)-dependent dehydrogenase (short-subunit alcohol dehydrogenase family)